MAVALNTCTPWYIPVYLRMLLYTPVSFRSSTKASAENTANGQNK